MARKVLFPSGFTKVKLSPPHFKKREKSHSCLPCRSSSPMSFACLCGRSSESRPSHWPLDLLSASSCGAKFLLPYIYDISATRMFCEHEAKYFLQQHVATRGNLFICELNIPLCHITDCVSVLFDLMLKSSLYSQTHITAHDKETRE